MISSAAALRTKLPTVPGRLVVALGMVPADHVGQLAECAAGRFDPFIHALGSAMLANGGLAAAVAGKPLLVRLGWEANAVDSGFPWHVTGDGATWRDCFRRWVDILNPVADASTTPPTRAKNFVIVWNMANRGSFRHPIDNIWPGDGYVDIVGSQFYDRCPPLPAGNEAEWARRLSARDAHGNPAGPLAWLEYARSKGKPYAVPEWGVGGPTDICARPGTDNPQFIARMHDFFRLNAADLAFEAYFNGHGFTDDSKGSHKLFDPAPAFPDPAAPGYLAYVQRYNPDSAGAYRALWGGIPDPPPPELSIAALAGIAAEGDGGTTPFTFAVTRTGEPDQAVEAAWRVTGAVDAADFAGGALPSGTVRLEGGETSKTLTVAVRGDLEVEPDEAFELALSDPTGGAAIGAGSAAGTILNDDAEPPVLALAPLAAALAEGNGGTTRFTFRLDRSGDDRAAVGVGWRVVGVGAAAADFVGGVLPSGTVGLAAGQTSGTVTVAVRGDRQPEPDEIFDVTLSSPTGGAAIGVGTASGIILNDDLEPPVLALAALAAAADEGDGGTTTAFTFSVTRSGDASRAVGVRWRVGAGSADQGDFTGGVLPSGTVDLAPGETTGTFTVQVQGDAHVEGDETFGVTLSDPTGGALLGAAAAAATIRNDDVEPATLSVAALDAVKSEGRAGPTPFTFAVRRSGDSRRAVSAAWRVAGVEADATDFGGGVLAAGTVWLAAGETSRTLTVRVRGDRRVEPDEAFELALSDPTGGAAIGAGSAAGTILNDDAEPPVLALAPLAAALAEGNGGVKPFAFAVARSGDARAAVTVRWQVAVGGAGADDFAGGAPPSGTISLAAGETSGTLTVPVQGDLREEGDETFTVALSSPTGGAAIGAGSATATILNDDAETPSLAVAAADAAKAEGSGGATPFAFAVTRTGGTRKAVSVSWRVTGTGADAGDFAGGALPSGTVNLAAGQTGATVSVAVQGDLQVEADETFGVTLFSPTGGAAIGAGSATAVILNDDLVPPALAVAAADVAKPEGRAGVTPFTFTVTRTGDSGQAIRVGWRALGDGRQPADAADFAGGRLPAGSLSFRAGETRKTITVPVAGDTRRELAEGFAVTLVNPWPSAALRSATAQGTILNDDR